MNEPPAITHAAPDPRINLFPSRLLAKSIQILTKASRFLTPPQVSAAYLSNMNAPHLQVQCLSEANHTHTIFLPGAKRPLDAHLEPAKGNPSPDSIEFRIVELEIENSRLQRLVAELLLKNQRLREDEEEM